MAFAIVETGGKQIRVVEGEVVSIEKLPGSYRAGDTIVFDKVLLLDDGTTTKIGMPYLSGVSIEAELLLEGRAKKIMVRKFKAKTGYHRRYGHRQPFMKVKVGATKGK